MFTRIPRFSNVKNLGQAGTENPGLGGAKNPGLGGAKNLGFLYVLLFFAMLCYVFAMFCYVLLCFVTVPGSLLRCEESASSSP